MPLLDVHGNLLSQQSPNIDAIRQGFQQYQEWVLSDSSTTFQKAATARQLKPSNNITSYFSYPGSHGRLGYPVLRYIYETSSSVRPAVDSIARKLSGLPWVCLYKDLKWHAGGKVDSLTEFFHDLNSDKEDLSIVLARFINDLLVIGRGVIEKVRGPGGDILELVARDAAYFTPKLSPDYKNIIGYVYRGGTVTNTSNLINPPSYMLDDKGNDIFFNKEDIIFKSYSPVTYTHLTLPIIETIVNEISLILLATKSIAWAFMNDEIPQGVLHLGQIGDEALLRAKESFQATRGIAQGNSTLKVLDNVDKVEWIPFQRPFREMQLAQLLPIIERVIARNFGLAPVEAGLPTTGTGTALSVSVSAAESAMILPLMNMVQEMLTTEVIKEFDKAIMFQWSSRPQENDAEKSKSLLELQSGGILSANEARLSLGWPLVKGGDIRFVKLGNEVVPLDEETGLPQYNNPVLPGAGAAGDKWQPGQPPIAPQEPAPAKPPQEPKKPGQPQAAQPAKGA